MNRPFPVDAALTAVALGYRNSAAMRIADEVLPRMPVSAEKFKWTEYPLSEAFNIPDARVGRRGRVQQLEFGGTEQTAAVIDYGLEVSIPYSDVIEYEAARARGDSLHDPVLHSVAMLADTIDNIREARVAGLVFALDTYAPTRRITLAGSSQWSDYAGSDPISAIKTGMDATLVYRPNTIVMGREVWNRLSSHPAIVNAVKGNVTSAGIVNQQQFQELFAGEGIQRVLVGDAWTNTAKPGQTPALARAWGKHCALIHLNPMASVEQGGVTFGFTAQFGSRIAGRMEDENIGLQGGLRVRAGERVRELVVARDVGYFFQNAVA